MRSIDLSGGLSLSELREIEQGLAREGNIRGTFGAPSNLDTLANAMTYGQAGRARQVENQNQLAKAISASTAFLPASRSGMDVFQVATGKPSVPNTGENKFTGINNPSFGDVTSLSNPLLSNLNQQQLQNNQIKANEKDWLDQFVQFTEGLGNIGSVS